MERVKQITVNAKKLLHVCGMRSEGDNVSRSLDGVTSDLDVEALAKGLLELIRELDQYLQSLLQSNKPASLLLQEEVARLEKDLTTKAELMKRTDDMITDAHTKIEKLKTQHTNALYNSSTS
ncbi:hypothetical protein NDN08_003088 [Rhodosorus marinus]|uniref:Uncharacterized protein n=1 Tax=Rhodosorus marinus TaxID=101924 RepID=A0AAV8UVW2_9RHOD|nr:hypothetical protein NDN08_003088 [Rhodosorus marinus]